MATGSATISSLDSTAASQTVVAANLGRTGLVLHNTDANDCYIAYGATATTSNGGYTEVILTGETWYMPSPIFTGVVYAIWSGDGSGGLSITEY